MIPARITGGWLRHGISIDGGPSVEDTLAWRLQAPSKHCDLRLPFSGTDGVMCRAGTTGWENHSLTWRAEVELRPSTSSNSAVITWDGADMMVAGVNDEGTRQLPYVERWVRLPGSDGELLALSYTGDGVTGRIVTAGRYALSIVDARPGGKPFTTTGWRLVDGSWTVDHRWPKDATTPAPPTSIAQNARTVVLDDGSEWTVDEHHVPREARLP